MIKRYKHKKRGTTYAIVAIGKIQAGDLWRFTVKHPPDGFFTSEYRIDGQEVVIYRCLEDGEYWVRPKDEFFDGRFEELVFDLPEGDDSTKLSSGRDIWELANQLGGYPGPGTDPKLASFLFREAKAAEEMANEIIRLRIELVEANKRAETAYQRAYERRLARHRSGCACNIDPDTDELLSMCMLHVDEIQEAKNKAYEEAAKVAEEHLTARVDNTLMPTYALHLGASSIAAMIRELKVKTDG